MINLSDILDTAEDIGFSIATTNGIWIIQRNEEWAIFGASGKGKGELYPDTAIALGLTGDVVTSRKVKEPRYIDYKDPRDGEWLADDEITETTINDILGGE